MGRVTTAAGVKGCTAAGSTVAAALADLDRQFPGVAAYLIHENGTLRQHVNIFVGNEPVVDRQQLSDPLSDADELIIMQALSGG